jgi:hypothetical protein
MVVVFFHIGFLVWWAGEFIVLFLIKRNIFESNFFKWDSPYSILGTIPITTEGERWFIAQSAFFYQFTVHTSSTVVYPPLLEIITNPWSKNVVPDRKHREVGYWLWGMQNIYYWLTGILYIAFTATNIYVIFAMLVGRMIPVMILTRIILFTKWLAKEGSGGNDTSEAEVAATAESGEAPSGGTGTPIKIPSLIARGSRHNRVYRRDLF